MFKAAPNNNIRWGCLAFSASSSSDSRQSASAQPVGNILILDHLNINHEKGTLEIRSDLGSVSS